MSSELYRVGSIAGVFGLKGELKLDPTGAGEALFSPGAVFLARPHEREIELATVRTHKGRLLIQLVQAPTIALAETYVGAQLFADRMAVDAELQADEILDVDLIGVMLHDAEGNSLGAVVDVEHYPSSAMLVVGSRRTLIPFVKAFIKSFDREAKIMELDLPKVYSTVK